MQSGEVDSPQTLRKVGKRNAKFGTSTNLKKDNYNLMEKEKEKETSA